MPREHRKRGKKHKKAPEEHYPIREESVQLQREPAQEEPRGEPAWIVPAQKAQEEVDTEAPFGFVDADVKAYFRTVDVQIRDWQDSQGDDTGASGDVDPNEQKRLFFMAALNEMHGKERQLATDPDCSVILERMTHSMDDFVRRVFADSLAGSYDVLVRHRFASHVCQTLFTLAGDTISRETKGIMPEVPQSEEKGELRTLTQLVLDISEELLPKFPALVMDPFASHVVRSLILLLSPNLSLSEDSSRSALRSKKSAAWKAKQGQMKSVFDESKSKGKETLRSTPASFRQMAKRFVEEVKNQLDENETRAMAANKVACPGLQMLVEVEADQDVVNESGSLMDRVTAGLITSCLQDPTADVEESDFLGVLLRDANASHLLEIVVSRCPQDAFNALWKTYFKGKLARLAHHPVANFVLAKAIERVSEDQLSEIFEELPDTWQKLIRTSRTGVLRAVVDRMAVLKPSVSSISEAVYSAFCITDSEDKALVAPTALSLLPIQEYKAALANQPPSERQPAHHGGPRAHAQHDPLEPKIQGSVLLQSLLRLPEPHNQFVIDSIHAVSVDDRIKIAQNSMGSRVFDALLDSPTVPAKTKRQFVMDFIGNYHTLVDDKLGSRVGDRCWAFCDTYLKEKIARSLVAQEQFLAGSFYGKFFARNLNLYLLQRRPEEWRNLQSERKRSQEQPQNQKMQLLPESKLSETQLPDTRKRKFRPENEIDALFNEKLGKRIKKAALVADVPAEPPNIKSAKVRDQDLQQILGAIRIAPANAGHVKKKKKA